MEENEFDVFMDEVPVESVEGPPLGGECTEEGFTETQDPHVFN